MLTQITDPLIWFLAWLFVVFGIIVFIMLLVYAKYGRDLSIKYALIFIIIASVLLGFSIHFFLVSFGI
ncbi:MAG: hypothetical protein KGD57_08510 [Candidatus Lokiarchaeota archaeon]|nr:hypothetical protein [Candidatus Lokiarchaeota archaeon]